MDILNSLLKRPYWVSALVVGAALVALPCVTVDKDYHLITHAPSTWLLVMVGVGLIFFSMFAFLLNLRWSRETADPGLDISRVRQEGGALLTSVGGCKLQVVNGRLEEYADTGAAAVVLPCNEYFDDRCAGDTGSALGAYVNRVFDGQCADFVTLVQYECAKKFRDPKELQKTDNERALSYGAGRCLFIAKPLGRSVSIALVSTTTQRAGEGLSGRISYVFEGMRELAESLADARVTEAVMPILGAGHGGIDPPMAFVGQILAIAEVARYGRGAQRLKKATIVVFQADPAGRPAVDQGVVRRTLALVGSKG